MHREVVMEGTLEKPGRFGLHGGLQGGRRAGL